MSINLHQNMSINKSHVVIIPHSVYRELVDNAIATGEDPRLEITNLGGLVIRSHKADRGIYRFAPVVLNTDMETD